MVESLGDWDTCEDVLECRWPRGGRLGGSGLAGASSPAAMGVVLETAVRSTRYLVVDCSGCAYQWRHAVRLGSALCVGYDGVDDKATPQQRENKVRGCPRHFLSKGHQVESSLRGVSEDYLQPFTIS